MKERKKAKDGGRTYSALDDREMAREYEEEIGVLSPLMDDRVAGRIFGHGQPILDKCNYHH